MLISSALKTSSSCVGMCISLGKSFFDGIDKVDSEILPNLRKIAKDLHPRVLLSYGMLFWFCMEVM